MSMRDPRNAPIEAATERMEELRGKGEYRAAREEGTAARKLVETPRGAELLDVAMALATYRDPDHRVRAGLHEATHLLRRHLDTSADPETFGAAGAVARRFYDLDLRSEHLENAL